MHPIGAGGQGRQGSNISPLSLPSPKSPQSDTDRDVASGQVIRNYGIELISTDGQSGIQNAYADGLPGIEMSQRSRRRSASGLGQSRNPFWE
ncbi:MAG: hypothetical protein V7L11_27895 [Nostoc sp.]|uniref:hypothetical protein n=1 Tax=Nostoc sp. TaxID=1180 RepID=UPI002FF46E5C